MSTPQDPGNTPQDPSDPQNPYGTPPSTPPSTPPNTPPPPYVPPPEQPQAPPTTSIPPASSPYGEPAPPPAYGSPAYGTPPPSAAPPPYGQPGGPMPGQYPGAPGAPGSGEPGKGMAITALVLAILGCTCIGVVVAIPLAIIVLMRGRDGRNHGKGLAIAALVISVLYIIGWVVGGAAIYNYAKDFKDVNDLKAGDCITAKGLSDAGAESVTEIRSVGCSEKHDGEVLVTVKLTKDQADNYSTTPFAEICDPAIEAAGKTGLLSDTVTYTALTVADPESGDTAACVAYNADGSKLTSKLGS